MSDPRRVTRSFVEAVSAGDAELACSFLDPDYEWIENGVRRGRAEAERRIRWMTGQSELVQEAVGREQIAPDTVLEEFLVRDQNGEEIGRGTAECLVRDGKLARAVMSWAGVPELARTLEALEDARA